MDCLSLPGRPLEEIFWRLPTAEIAAALLGKLLVRRYQGNLLVGRIVETEAYLSQGDPACHASRGMTPRNRPMFGPPGRAYVYFIYGNHFCLNAVTAPEGTGEAVLIRALEPLAGLEVMIRLRGRQEVATLCSGPGRLCQAMGIDASCNNADLSRGELCLLDDGTVFGEIRAVPRIGIRLAVDLPLRFYPVGSKFVSGKQAK